MAMLIDQDHFRMRRPEQVPVDRELADRILGGPTSPNMLQRVEAIARYPLTLRQALGMWAVTAVIGGMSFVGNLSKKDSEAVASPSPNAELVETNLLQPTLKTAAGQVARVIDKKVNPTEEQLVAQEVETLNSNFEPVEVVVRPGDNPETIGKRVNPQFYTGPQSSEIKVKAMQEIIEPQTMPPYKTIQPRQSVWVPKEPPTSYPNH